MVLSLLSLIPNIHIYSLNFLRTSSLEEQKFSDQNTAPTYISMNYSLSLLVSKHKGSKLYIPKSTICAVHLSNGPSPLTMMCSKISKSNPKGVSRSITKIIAYLLLLVSSTCHFRFTDCVVMNYGRQKLTLTF